MPNTLVDAPTAPTTLAVDQGRMEGNNFYYANTLKKDHQIGPADGSRNDGIVNEGRHKWAAFINQHGTAPTIPGQAPDTPDAIEYSDNGNLVVTSSINTSKAWQLTTCKTGLNNGVPQVAIDTLFGTNTVYDGSHTNWVGGWTFLPGGLILQYGTNNTPGNGTGTVNFSFSFTNCFQVLITGLRNSTNVDSLYVKSKTNANFQYITSTSGTGFTSFDWIAIGN